MQIDSECRQHTMRKISILGGSAMRPRGLRSTISMLGIGAAVLSAAHLALITKAASASRFHLEEATIADVQRAIRAKEITAEQLVQLYFKRIEAYNGTCVKGAIDPATGLMFGEITPIENAGQVNAYMTLNIRGKRSRTDPVDNDPAMPDALETARARFWGGETDPDRRIVLQLHRDCRDWEFDEAE